MHTYVHIYIYKSVYVWYTIYHYWRSPPKSPAMHRAIVKNGSSHQIICGWFFKITLQFRYTRAWGPNFIHKKFEIVYVSGFAAFWCGSFTTPKVPTTPMLIQRLLSQRGGAAEHEARLWILVLKDSVVSSRMWNFHEFPSFWHDSLFRCRGWNRFKN